MTTLLTRVRSIPRELELFALATFMSGIAYSLFDSVFNNFLNERFDLTGFQRSFLEVPRELPGFLVVFVSAGLAFLCSRRLGAYSMLMGVVGALLIGYASSSYAIMTVWLFTYSMGQHLFMPVSSGIGMDLAREGQLGKRLGQLSSVRNVAVILGSAAVTIGFRYLGMTFQQTFTLTAIGLAIAAVILFSMKRAAPIPSGTYLKLKREYSLYYWLAVLSGSRKQLFITFAPWVLITVFNQPTQTIAILMTIGGVIGIAFQPVLGWAVDRLGERRILAAEGVVLVFVCLGYGFAKFVFPENIAFYVVCACYLLDQMLFAVGIARSTYMKKIARDPQDVQPALTAAVTIDHIFSITVALVGGAIWSTFGFQYVFLMGIVIAVINFFTALRVRVPQTGQAAGA
ncbi:MAG: MFS transporter [Anaerolineales bacterium]|jgi:predicted MFS family arabinose efflux permease|nr:MFS transporter [Anaerolineales bacterium]